jgi:hypothetical protein
MPRTALAIQDVPPQSKLAVVYSAADNANNNSFDNDGKTLLLVRNPTGGALAATIPSVTDENGRTGDLALTVAAGETQVVGPLKSSLYNQSSDSNKVWVNPASGLTLAAVRLARN